MFRTMIIVKQDSPDKLCEFIYFSLTLFVIVKFWISFKVLKLKQSIFLTACETKIIIIYLCF